MHMKVNLQKTTLLGITCVFFNLGLAQTTLYSENFEGTHAWTLNVATGINGAHNNFFTVSSNEGGVVPPGCSVTNNGNKTLHVTSVYSPNGGAKYDAGGLCGILYCPQTNMRAESPSFSTIGYATISLSFDFIGNGDGLQDNASLWYNAGSGWNVLASSLKSILCGNGNGQWTNMSLVLPAAAENNPNVKIGFNWTNNDDGVGTDPSFAVNNIVVSSSNALSISDFENLKAKIRIYPNPASTVLKIESSSNETFFISNQLGQIVKQFSTQGNSINEIAIDDLTKGIYFIKNSSSTFYKKLIIE